MRPKKVPYTLIYNFKSCINSFLSVFFNCYFWPNFNRGSGWKYFRK